MKILVVEDDSDQRDLIRETLVDHFGKDTVTAAECGHEVLGWDLAQFDVILTDFNLPDINGMDFLKTVLSRCDRPVIGSTSNSVRSPRRSTTRHFVCAGRPCTKSTMCRGGRSKSFRNGRSTKPCSAAGKPTTTAR